MSSQRPNSRMIVVVTLAVAITTIMPNCIFADTRVEVQIGGLLGSSCEGSPRPMLVTGSIGKIAVNVFSVGTPVPFTEFPSAQPPWLDLEFSYGSQWDTFVPSSQLHDLLKPTYFRDVHQSETNERIARGEEVMSFRKLPTYYFSYEVPNELAGTEICVRAVLSPPPYGRISPDRGPDFRNLACIRFLEPCSQEDRDLALASHISRAKDMGDNARVVALTDSLIETGWRSLLGLGLARTAANQLQDYTSSLRFLDVMYNTYGVADAFTGATGSWADSSYKVMRNFYIQKISQQEEQR